MMHTIHDFKGIVNLIIESETELEEIVEKNIT